MCLSCVSLQQPYNRGGTYNTTPYVFIMWDTEHTLRLRSGRIREYHSESLFTRTWVKCVFRMGVIAVRVRWCIITTTQPHCRTQNKRQKTVCYVDEHMQFTNARRSPFFRAAVFKMFHQFGTSHSFCQWSCVCCVCMSIRKQCVYA